MVFSSRLRYVRDTWVLQSSAPMMSFPPTSLMPFLSRSTCCRLVFSFNMSASSLTPGSPRLFSSKMIWVRELLPFRLSKSSFHADRSALSVCASPRYCSCEWDLMYDAKTLTPSLPRPFPPISSSRSVKALKELQPMGSCSSAFFSNGKGSIW